MTPKRLTETAAIEHRLLDLAYTTDATITASALAYYAPCSFEDADKVLTDLAARDRIRMDVDDNGIISYHVPDRHKLRPAVEVVPPRRDTYALVRHVQPAALVRTRTASPLLAAALSMFIPGAGQLYTGRFLSAVLWFMVVGAGYALIIPGLILHFFCILSAASSAARLNTAVSRIQLAA